MINKVQDKKEAFIKYVQKHSLAATARHFNITEAYAYKLRKDWLGITNKKKNKAPDKKEFVEYKKTHTYDECVEHFGISKMLVYKYIQQYGCQSYHVKEKDYFVNGHNIRTEFPEYAKEHTQTECAKYFKVSPLTIHNWCSKYKVYPKAKGKTYKVVALKLYIVYRDDDVRYFTNIQDIAMFFNYTTPYVSTLINRDKQIKDYKIITTNITSYRHSGQAYGYKESL